MKLSFLSRLSIAHSEKIKFVEICCQNFYDSQVFVSLNSMKMTTVGGGGGSEISFFFFTDHLR